MNTIREFKEAMLRGRQMVDDQGFSSMFDGWNDEKNLPERACAIGCALIGSGLYDPDDHFVNLNWVYALEKMGAIDWFVYSGLKSANFGEEIVWMNDSRGWSIDKIAEQIEMWERELE